VSEYVVHDHRERNDQGMGNRLLTPEHVVRLANNNAPIERRERLGGAAQRPAATTAIATRQPRQRRRWEFESSHCRHGKPHKGSYTIVLATPDRRLFRVGIA
jgi:hypothetical protein